jgi:hypothetical protein
VIAETAYREKIGQTYLHHTLFWGLDSGGIMRHFPTPTKECETMRTPIHKWLLLAAALILAPAVYAQPAPARESCARQDRSYAQGLLWKIEGASGEPSYVFGTMHVADVRILALPAPVRASFDGAKHFATEVTLDSADLKTGRAFVAVGALHLYGERGVLALLATRGYTDTRVY